MVFLRSGEVMCTSWQDLPDGTTTNGPPLGAGHALSLELIVPWGFDPTVQHHGRPSVCLVPPDGGSGAFPSFSSIALYHGRGNTGRSVIPISRAQTSPCFSPWPPRFQKAGDSGHQEACRATVCRDGRTMSGCVGRRSKDPRGQKICASRQRRSPAHEAVSNETCVAMVPFQRQSKKPGRRS